MTDEEYEQKRKQAIEQYNVLYKDTLAFDLIKADKALRVRLLQDPIYQQETKACKASLFVGQLQVLDQVLAGKYAEAGKDQSATILKALDMKNKLLLEDLSINQDDKSAMNITFTAMSKADFEALGTVEIYTGSNGATIDSSFGESADEESAESRMKADLKRKIKEAEDKEQQAQKDNDEYDEYDDEDEDEEEDDEYDDDDSYDEEEE